MAEDIDGSEVGESLAVLERLIVAPAAGVFRAAAAAAVGVGVGVGGGVRPARVGDALEAGELLGFVVNMGDEMPVRLAFGGVLCGVLVEDGERVQIGSPVAWMRTEAGTRSRKPVGVSRQQSAPAGL